MKKILLAVVITVAVVMGLWMGSAKAQSAPPEVATLLDQLSPEVKKQIASALTKDVATQEKAAKAEKESVSGQMAEWGRAIGVGVAEAAKGVGVAASDFFSTSAGTFVAVLIAVKVVGPFFAHIFGGLFLGIVGFIMIRHLARRMCNDLYEYDETSKNVFGNYPLKRVKTDNLSEGGAFGIGVMSVILIVAVGLVFGTI